LTDLGSWIIKEIERNKYGHNTIKKNSRCSGGDPETSEARYAKV
tara:strand:+ start:88 stop:219 length:132 start_codon:yes stop_codon:yes gene_type:complete